MRATFTRYPQSTGGRISAEEAPFFGEGPDIDRDIRRLPRPGVSQFHRRTGNI